MVGQRKTINTYDIDGVISIGITPRSEDVIISGRSYEEAPETYKFLQQRGIYNVVYFQPMTYEGTSRESSGQWKAHVLRMLEENGIHVEKHFEDDEVQKAEIEKLVDTPVVLLSHNLTNKEKERHIS